MADVFFRWVCKIFLSLVLFTILANFVFAADWHLVPLKTDFSNSFSDLCFYDAQCLVNDKGNPLLDNNPEKWYSSRKNKEDPRCIDNYQYLLDYYCDRGNWTSRTRIVGLELFGAAYTPGRTQFNKNFTIVCGAYNFVLNTLNYNNKFVNVQTFLNRNLNTQIVSNKKWHPILNNICIIDFDNHIILGASLNSEINGSDSFLKALNFNENVCDSRAGSFTTAAYSTEYLGCNGGNFTVRSGKPYYELYYDNKTNTLIYDPEMILNPYPINTLLQLYPNLIEPEFINPLLIYSKTFAHDPSATIGRNFSLFNDRKMYNNIYFSLKGNTSIFAFIEEDQTYNHLDYLGFISKEISYPQMTCNIIVNSDKNAITYCQNNSPPDYMLVSKKPNYNTPKLIELWKGLTSLIKVK